MGFECDQNVVEFRGCTRTRRRILRGRLADAAPIWINDQWRLYIFTVSLPGCYEKHERRKNRS